MRLHRDFTGPSVAATCLLSTPDTTSVIPVPVRQPPHALRMRHPRTKGYHTVVSALRRCSRKGRRVDQSSAQEGARSRAFGGTVGSRMADKGPILVTGAAGQLGGVGRTVTGLLLDRGLPVRALVRRDASFSPSPVRASAIEAVSNCRSDGARPIRLPRLMSLGSSRPSSPTLGRT